MWCANAPTRRLTRASAVRALIAVPFIAGPVAAAHAQTPDRAARQPTAADSVFARARQLVVAGNGAAGRVLVDSMVAAAQPETPAYADALFWRGSLAVTGSDAERDYRKIVVEYPMSPHAGQALLQLAQLEAARGDRGAATPHLERYLLENPNSPDVGRAGLLFVRLSFEQNDVQRACRALPRALTVVPARDVELRNQLDYYSPRCAGVDTTRAPAPAAVTPPARGPAVRAPAAHVPAPRPPAPPPPRVTGRFTLQVAAYTTRAEADRLARSLKARGIDARITGTSKLFRVRVGHYATRAAATAAAKALKARNIKGFVTDAGADDR